MGCRRPTSGRPVTLIPMRVESFRQTPPFDRLLFLLSRWTPKLDRVLVIESGARPAAERFLTRLYIEEPAHLVDLLTCYGSAPAAFDPARGQIFYTHRAQSGGARAELFRGFRAADYSAVCMLCTGDDIMTKWKWAAAVRVPAKVMIVNENADTFWLDRGHIRELKGMARDRVGSAWLMPLRIAYQILAFPFTVSVLLTFAAVVHGRRLWRLRQG
jgi:hypothetical protein